MFKLSKERLYFVTLFILIALIMLALHLAPPSLQDKLVLNYQSFSFSNPADWLRLYTMHFVHKDFWHLLNNLITFAIIFPLIYFLAEIGNSFDSFKRLLIFVFIILPPVIALLDLLVMRRYNLRYGMGFSGIDAALIGAVPYFSANFLKKKLGFNISPLTFSNSFMLIAGGLIALIYAFFIIGIPLILVGLLMLLYSISKAFKEYDWESKGEKVQKLRTSIRNFILAILLVMTAAIWGAFPRNIVARAGMVNIFIHYLGLISTLYIFPLFEDLIFRD
ncbi:MAG: hypothetical protein H0Z18_04820 [Thermococcus sp.]|uniref:hypothetical protein n=1 Tax=Thermococcus sp. TaxID=35749 RepID=UPI001DB9D5C5|nr:hypothetical protein [Thermococcus sp.]MBO8174561.1 hypothetical protein [Thermococcus sp.]